MKTKNLKKWRNTLIKNDNLTLKLLFKTKKLMGIVVIFYYENMKVDKIWKQLLSINKKKKVEFFLWSSIFSIIFELLEI